MANKKRMKDGEDAEVLRRPLGVAPENAGVLRHPLGAAAAAGFAEGAEEAEAENVGDAARAFIKGAAVGRGEVTPAMKRIAKRRAAGGTNR